MRTLSAFLISAVSTGIVAVDTRFSEAQNGGIAVVDMRRAVSETEEGRRVTAGLKKTFEIKQKELDERQRILKVSVEDLDRKRSLLSADVIRQKEGELQSKMNALREMFGRHQEELARRQNEALDPLLSRISSIVEAVSAAANLAIVFDRSQLGLIVHAKPHLDITNEVISIRPADDVFRRPLP